jgi:hypothetical protein
MKEVITMKTNNSIKFDEIHKLNALLNATGVPHTFGPLFDGYQIRVYEDEEMTREIDDCVIHGGSHGHKQGLLESFTLGGCDGWETAEQIYKGWMEMYRKAQKNKIGG